MRASFSFFQQTGRCLTLAYFVGLLTLIIIAFFIATPPKASAACAAQDTSRGQVTSNFSVPTNGTYRVWSRIQAPDSTNNSYILEIDGTTCAIVVGDNTSIPANTWTWVNYKNGSTSSYIDVSLTAGSHTMVVIGREDNVELDRVVFTTDTSCVPTGTGDNCANPPDTTPPTVSITSPVNGATVNGTSTITATASDDTALSKVEFYVDGTLKASDTVTPYSYALDTTTLTNASHTVMAKAYDTSNNSTSSTITLTVSNAAVCKSGSSTLPTTPSNLIKTTSSYTSITLSWGASTPSPGCTISGYRIFRAGSQVGTVTTGTSYTDSGLMSGTSYSYTVQAYDSGANSSAKTAISNFSTVADNVAPSIPGSFSATSSSAASVSLSWTVSTDNPNPGGVGVKAYNIYRNGASTPTYVVSSPVATSYSDTNVSASTAYSYVITSVDNNNNESAPSAVKSATTAAPTCSGTPSVPTNLHATTQTLNSITFSWNASTPSAGCTLNGYHIYRGGVFLADVTSGTAYTNTSLYPNTSYSYTIAAFDTSAHTSAQTSAVSMSTLADTVAPSTPGTVTASAVSSGKVNLAWGASSDNVAVTAYKIYRGGSLLVTLAASSRSYSDTTVIANTDYSYQISAIDGANNESSKTTASPSPVHTPVAVDTTAPTSPSSLNVPIVTAQSANIVWSSSTDNVAVAGYHIYVNGVYLADTATTSYAVSCLAPNVNYTFTITSFDNAGNTSNAATVSALSLADGLSGDLNCDQFVNSTDLFTMLRNWGQSSLLPSYGDVTGDTKINSTDLFNLLRNWGKSS